MRKLGYTWDYFPVAVYRYIDDLYPDLKREKRHILFDELFNAWESGCIIIEEEW